MDPDPGVRSRGSDRGYPDTGYPDPGGQLCTGSVWIQIQGSDPGGSDPGGQIEGTQIQGHPGVPPNHPYDVKSSIGLAGSTVLLDTVSPPYMTKGSKGGLATWPSSRGVL